MHARQPRNRLILQNNCKIQDCTKTHRLTLVHWAKNLRVPRGTEGHRVRKRAGCRGSSLIRNTPLLGPYSRTIPRVLRWSWGGGLFLMSEVPLWSCSGRSSRCWRPSHMDATRKHIAVVSETVLGQKTDPQRSRGYSPGRMQALASPLAGGMDRMDATRQQIAVLPGWECIRRRVADDKDIERPTSGRLHAPPPPAT